MEKKTKYKKKSNIPKCEAGIKKKNEFSKLIPFHIPSANHAYLLPEQYKKNTVLINDLETLNDSSFTNNFEGISKEQQSFGDSISIIPSREGSKTSLLEDKNKKNDIAKFQEDLIKKEKENILLKNKIDDLQKIIISIKEESSNQKKLLKVNENFEEKINILKNENCLKEKIYLEQIEKLKNDIKNKDIILNTLKDKIIFKNQVIKNLNNIIKTKDLKIEEFNKILKKYQYIKKNISSYSNLNRNKEDENYNIKNIKNYKIYKEMQQNVNLKQFLKKFKKINDIKKDKIKNVNRNTEDRSTSKIFKKSKIHHSGSFHDKRQIKNYNYIDESKIANMQKKKIKDISLKKQLALSNQIIYKIKNNKNKSKNNENNSMKNLFNLNLDRNSNSFRQFSNINSFSYISYTNKTNEPEYIKDNKRNIDINNINNITNKNLIKDENPKEVFIKRLYKNNKKIIKTSISDSTNSYIYSDNENNKNNIKDIHNSKNKTDNNFNSDNNDNKSYDFNLNEYIKKNFYLSNINYNNKIVNKGIYNNRKSANQKYRIMKKKNNELGTIRRTANNQRIDNIENIDNNDKSLLSEVNMENIEKKNTFIQGKYKYKKPCINCNNSINDSNLNSSKSKRNKLKINNNNIISN